MSTVKKDDEEPRDGWGHERIISKRGRKVTLTLEGVALHLPGEESAPQVPNEDALQSQGGTPSEAAAHLDGWSADRVRRVSFPSSLGEPASVPPLSARTPEGVLRPAPEASSTGALLERVSESEGDALALAGRRLRPTPTLDLVSEMSDRFALGDFTGSLRAAELVLGQAVGLAPDDPRSSAHDLARHYAHESRQKLESLYQSRLCSQGRVPKLALPESEIRWLGLDSRMGFLLSRIDGVSDYETILELSGMPRLEALRSLAELVDAKVIRIV